MVSGPDPDDGKIRGRRHQRIPTLIEILRDDAVVSGKDFLDALGNWVAIPVAARGYYPPPIGKALAESEYEVEDGPIITGKILTDEASLAQEDQQSVNASLAYYRGKAVYMIKQYLRELGLKFSDENSPVKEDGSVMLNKAELEAAMSEKRHSLPVPGQTRLRY